MSDRAGSRFTSLVYCNMQYSEFSSVAHRSTSCMAYIKTCALDGVREESLGAFFTMRKRPYCSLVFVGSFFCFVLLLFFLFSLFVFIQSKTKKAYEFVPMWKLEWDAKKHILECLIDLQKRKIIDPDTFIIMCKKYNLVFKYNSIRLTL